MARKIAVALYLAVVMLTGVAVLAAEDQAEQILEATGVKGGLVVHLGCGDGKLTAALHPGESFLVQGLDADANHVEAARKHIRSLGLYGPVSVQQWSGNRLPYIDNLVNLLVISDANCKVADEEIQRVLAPRGMAIWLNPRSKIQDRQFTKPWPTQIDEWTHYLHGPDNNAVAKDSLVGPPKGVQWMEGPLWQRHHEMNANPNALVSAKGRLFYIYDDAPATVAGLPDQWVLAARDAFNGVLLWKRPISEWGWKAWSAVETGGRFNLPVHIPRRLVAIGDRVYVTLGFNAPLTALDAATGKTLRTYEGTQSTDEILACDGLLVLSVNETPQRPDIASRRKQLKRQAKADPAPPQPTETSDGPLAVKKRVMVLKADTGEILWSQAGFQGVSSSPILGNLEHITRLLMAVGGGKVVCVEKEALVALDLQTGRELWRTRRLELPARPGLRENVYNFSTLIIHQDMVLLLQTEESYDLAAGTGKRGVHCRLLGYAADTGKELWSVPCSKWGPAVEGDVFVINDLVWTHDANDFAVIGIDLHSGQIKRKISTKEAFDEVHHHRCFRNKATEQYLLTARRGIETIDLKQEQTTKNEWVRGACRYGIMPCNGLLYVPPHPCQCYITVKLSGFYALSSERKGPEFMVQGLGESEKAGRLQQGPAFTLTPNPQSLILKPSDWPTYRHDARRSGSTTSSAPAELQRLWQAHLGSRASACTIAGGRVFAAAIDEHRVVALDAKDGHVLWDYTAGGRVDTPPTVDGDRVLFGSADGWVYCLRAADGALAWRFRAAPDDRCIVALGQLESLWPVHGTVLLSNGVAYVAAGRSTHLDGGIRVCAIKANTGELIRELRPLNGDPQGLEDVLVGDGDRVYMRHLEFSLGEGPADTAQKAGGKPSATSPRAYSTAGLLDDSYFARVGWTIKGQTKKNGKAKLEKDVGAADLLIFDGRSTFTFRSSRQGGFGGWFQAGAGSYELASRDLLLGKSRWSIKIPVRVRAMAAAGPVLFVAGPRDTVDSKDPWATVEGRAGSVLWALAADDGKKLTEYDLDAAPAWDGLAVASGRLYLSLKDGRVMCMSGK